MGWRGLRAAAAIAERVPRGPCHRGLALLWQAGLVDGVCGRRRRCGQEARQRNSPERGTRERRDGLTLRPCIPAPAKTPQLGRESPSAAAAAWVGRDTWYSLLPCIYVSRTGPHARYMALSDSARPEIWIRDGYSWHRTNVVACRNNSRRTDQRPVMPVLASKTLARLARPGIVPSQARSKHI